MSAPASSDRSLRVLVGYDGSRSAVNAVEAAARLVPAAEATVVHLWEPPFTSPELRARLAGRARGLEALGRLLETEGLAEAERLAGNGVSLARAAGWNAEPLVRRAFGGDGYQFARMAEELGADLVVVGSRGLGGVRASLGSVSDFVVQVSPVPVLVVPCPLTTAEWTAAAEGPVLVATDGSPGAQRAAAVARDLLPGREQLLVTVAGAGGTPEGGTDGAEVLQVTAPRRSGSARAVATTLADTAAAREAGVVVVGSRGHSTSHELLVGSVPTALLHCAHRPVLVVPASRVPGAPA